MQSSHPDNKSSNESANSSATSSSVPKVQGTRLRYERDLIGRHNMKKKLYINHLEQLTSGEGYYYVPSEIQKCIQRLHDRTPSKELEKTLMRQLEEAKAMVAVVSERLENSPIGRESRVTSDQLNEYTHRMESAAGRWSGFLYQVQELQQQLGDNISRRPNQPNNQPQRVQAINEKSSYLIAESAAFSKTVHGILRNLAGLPHQIASSTGTGYNFKISGSVRCTLSARHGKRLFVLGKKLEELEKGVCK